MIAFRIGGGLHPVYDGTGAELNGGRWNSPGRRVIYAGQSFAIALLERLVQTGIGRVPANDRFVSITIPDALAIETVDPAALPGWNDASLVASRAHGDRWYDERRSAALLVPSAVTTIDRNVVINAAHPDFGQIMAWREQPVRWDARLFGVARSAIGGGR